MAWRFENFAGKGESDSVRPGRQRRRAAYMHGDPPPRSQSADLPLVGTTSRARRRRAPDALNVERWESPTPTSG